MRRVLWSTIYGAVMIAGISVLVQPPSSIRSLIGPQLALAWSLLLAVGGALGAWSTLTRWWVIERIAIIFAGTGATIYGATVLANHFLEQGNRLPQLMFICAFIMALSIRHWDIRRFNQAPKPATTPIAL